MLVSDTLGDGGGLRAHLAAVRVAHLVNAPDELRSRVKQLRRFSQRAGGLGLRGVAPGRRHFGECSGANGHILQRVPQAALFRAQAGLTQMREVDVVLPCLIAPLRMISPLLLR